MTSSLTFAFALFIQLAVTLLVTGFGLLIGTVLFFTPGIVKLLAAWLATF